MGLAGSLETMAVIIYLGEAATSSSSSGGSDGTRELSKELAKGVVLLQCESSAEGGACDVYLIGTAHVSQESFKEFKAVINYLKPEVVFLELCASRVAILTQQNLQDDYVRKIALKLLTVEARIPARDSAPPLPPSTPPLSPRRTVPHDEEEEEQDFEDGDANIASARFMKMMYAYAFWIPIH